MLAHELLRVACISLGSAIMAALAMWLLLREALDDMADQRDEARRDLALVRDTSGARGQALLDTRERVAQMTAERDQLREALSWVGHLTYAPADGAAIGSRLGAIRLAVNQGFTGDALDTPDMWKVS